MLTISVSDILSDSLPESGWGQFQIYIFRDTEFVLYVGKATQNIIDRLEQHLGLTYLTESQVGRLIADNAPESHGWLIDLLTFDDCKPIVERHFPFTRTIDVDISERAVILEYSPPLNSQSNPNPRALPHKYTRRRDARTLAAFKKVSNAKH